MNVSLKKQTDASDSLVELNEEMLESVVGGSQEHRIMQKHGHRGHECNWWHHHHHHHYWHYFADREGGILGDIF